MASAFWTVDSRWAMTNVVRPGHQGVHAALDDGLGVGVDRAGGLVHDHDRGIGHSRAGDGQQLALALGQVAPLPVSMVL